MYCDFHGHSRQKNVFMYGCRQPDRGTLLEEVLPSILGKTIPFFAVENCSYKVQKARTSTGRVVAYQELGIPLSYTLEASLCGGYGLIPAQPDVKAPEARDPTMAHFHVGHYCHMGQMFAKAVKVLASHELEGYTVRELVESGSLRPALASSTAQEPTTPLGEEDEEGDDGDSGEDE
uniref:Peptidase M14 domain-containing protein n=1 Tax=Eutreptiella gymnastica TaxID=73025 RepID=A0A7S4CVU9_9EUGL